MSAISTIKGDTFEFYGGKAVLKLRMYGDKPSFKRVGSEQTLLSVTGCTGKLDKSRALIPWACALVGTHVTSFVESAVAETFSKEEIRLLVAEAVLAPDRAKEAGATTGDLIHDYAHEFAKMKLAGKKGTPSLKHLDEKDENHQKALNGISAFLDWYNSNDVEFLEMEKMVYYNSFLAGDTDEANLWEYYGFIDLVAKVNGKLCVADYKSSKGIYNEQRYQVSGYRNAFGFVASDCSLIVNFNKITGELIPPLEIPNEEGAKDLQAFKGLYMAAMREKELDREYKNSKKAV